jgi:hypothetical protein
MSNFHNAAVGAKPESAKEEFGVAKNGQAAQTRVPLSLRGVVGQFASNAPAMPSRLKGDADAANGR